jgi:hypothetical protein
MLGYPAGSRQGRLRSSTQPTLDLSFWQNPCSIRTAINSYIMSLVCSCALAHRSATTNLFSRFTKLHILGTIPGDLRNLFLHDSVAHHSLLDFKRSSLFK